MDSASSMMSSARSCTVRPWERTSREPSGRSAVWQKNASLDRRHASDDQTIHQARAAEEVRAQVQDILHLTLARGEELSGRAHTRIGRNAKKGLTLGKICMDIRKVVSSIGHRRVWTEQQILDGGAQHRWQPQQQRDSDSHSNTHRQRLEIL